MNDLSMATWDELLGTAENSSLKDGIDAFLEMERRENPAAKSFPEFVSHAGLRHGRDLTKYFPPSSWGVESVRTAGFTEIHHQVQLWAHNELYERHYYVGKKYNYKDTLSLLEAKRLSALGKS